MAVTKLDCKVLLRQSVRHVLMRLVPSPWKNRHQLDRVGLGLVCALPDNSAQLLTIQMSHVWQHINFACKLDEGYVELAPLYEKPVNTIQVELLPIQRDRCEIIYQNSIATA